MQERAGAGKRLGGYVLAGGRSSRMGRDKALLKLGGRPLIAHAVAKLRRVTGEANILAGQAPGEPSLREFAPLVCDLHPGCGPLAGIEAALRHTPHQWNLILPVDVPFLPAAFLEAWVKLVIGDGEARTSVAFFRVDGVVHPTLLLIHREVLPMISAAIESRDYKLLPVLEYAAARFPRAAVGEQRSHPLVLTVEDVVRDAGFLLTEAQRAAQALWFANLNTPEEFAAAERDVDILDRLD